MSRYTKLRRQNIKLREVVIIQEDSAISAFLNILFIISYTDLATEHYCKDQGNPTKKRDKNLACFSAASVLTRSLYSLNITFWF